jgi:hypothetical protein
MKAPDLKCSYEHKGSMSTGYVPLRLSRDLFQSIITENRVEGIDPKPRNCHTDLGTQKYFQHSRKLASSKPCASTPLIHKIRDYVPNIVSGINSGW